MSKTFKATWLGDTDPNAQIIRMGDLRFIKGESVDVPADHEMAEYIHDNPTFAVDKAKAEPVEAIEQPVDTDTGTVKGGLKDAIVAAGGERPKGNPSEETLRATLAKLTA